MTLRVSIIINNFNYDEYIAPCIESAITQTYRNKEVIVSDDGSTDNSRAIIRSYGSSIITTFKPNGGQASALNAGYKISSGDLVIFLDSDDILSPSCVAEVVRHWRSDLTKLHFNLAVIDASGDPIGCLHSKPPLPRGDLREQLLTDGTVVSMGMSGNVFPRAFLNQVMPMPEVGWERGADTYLFNLATLSGQVGAIDEPLGGYRVHGNNGSAKVKEGKVDKAALRKFLQREILTDQSLTAYGQKIGVNSFFETAKFEFRRRLFNSCLLSPLGRCDQRESASRIRIRRLPRLFKHPLRIRKGARVEIANPAKYIRIRDTLS